MTGRLLSAGDALHVRTGGATDERRWPAGVKSSGITQSVEPVQLAVVEGPHLAQLPSAVREVLVEREWMVSARHARAGLRLKGDPIADVAAVDLVSTPMPPGAVQVLPNGQPIVLMPDAPTVGGYPVPAVVAAADRHRTGRLRSGDALCFTWIELDEARRRSRAQAEQLVAIADSFA